MDFSDALELLRTGKQVRLPEWSETSNYCMIKDILCVCKNNKKCETAIVTMDEMISVDWELFEGSTKTLSDKVTCAGIHTNIYHEEDIKEFIQQLKDKLLDLDEGSYGDVDKLIDELAGERFK